MSDVETQIMELRKTLRCLENVISATWDVLYELERTQNKPDVEIVSAGIIEAS